MKSSALTTISLCVLLAALGSSPVQGQEPQIRLDSLDMLAEQASETIDINVDGYLLKLAHIILGGTKHTSAAKVKELIDGLKGIYIRKFEFDEEGGYRAEDVQAIRAQLAPPVWMKVVGVRSGKGRENIEAYVRSEGNNITGVTIISAEPKELVVAHVIGTINIDKLAELFKEVDLPWLEWTRPGKSEKE